MEEQPTQPFPASKNQRLASARPRQQRRVLQLLVAFLVVCALIEVVDSMALVLHELQPTSLVWGKTLYTKPLGSLFSNAASLAWSPDSKRVASLTGDGVQIWDATTGAHWMISKVPDKFGILQMIAWSPNGEWIAVAAETGIAIVNAHSGALVHGYSISSLATSASQSLALPHGSPLDRLLPTSGGGSFVSSLAWSPDSRQLAVTDSVSTTGQDHFLIMNAQTGSLVHSFAVPAGESVTRASWSPDGNYLATSVTSAYPTPSDETSVWVWDRSTYQPVMQRSTNGGGETNLATTLVSSVCRNVCTKISFAPVLFRPEKPHSSFRYPAFVATKAARRGNQGRGEVSGGNPMAAGEFAWQPKSDNLLFAEGNSSPLRGGWEAPVIDLWNVTQNKLLKQYSFENAGIFAWSPNGHYFATGQSAADQVAIIDAQSGQQIYAYDQNDYRVLDVVWSPNGKYIASCGPSSVKVWTAL